MDAELSLPDDSYAAPRDAGDDVRRARVLLESEAGEAAREYLLREDSRTLDEQVALTEVPAPPFGEGPRGRLMAELMERSGLEGVETDAEGNVLGWLGAPGPAPLVVAAHLDTVFPEGTDVSVRRKGPRLEAPGIGDDGRGLAAVLAAARALEASEARIGRPLLVAATVGEEGAGDLRGVRHLFGPEGRARDAVAFLSLDGAGSRRIVNRAVGARRWRAVVRGPGGHSWVDWGTPNPLMALADGLSALGRLDLPLGLTFSVGRMGGGRSVNAIPQEAWAEMEIRSRSQGDLEETAPRVRRALEEAAERANGARRAGSDPLALELEQIGSRPAGETPVDAPVVRAAVAATRALGYPAELASSSTDANVPMALGIPAVTLGAGGLGGQAHTLEEWYRNDDGPEGILRAVLTVLLLDELVRSRVPA